MVGNNPEGHELLISVAVRRDNRLPHLTDAGNGDAVREKFGLNVIWKGSNRKTPKNTDG